MIHIFQGTNDYAIEAISSDLLNAFNNASKSLGHHDPASYSVVLKTFECFLQLTNQTLDLEQVKLPIFKEICALYIGSIYSTKVFSVSQIRKYQLFKCFELLVKTLEIQICAYPLQKITANIAKTTPEIYELILHFEKLELNEEKLWIWKGWPCLNKRGSTHWAPLYPIYIRLGREFTQKLHTVCKEYALGRRDNGIPCLKLLADFIGQYEGQLEVDDFQNPRFMVKFWRGFLTYYMTTRYANGQGSKVSTLTSEWRANFLYFVEKYLVNSKLIVRVFGEMPIPPPVLVTGAETNVRTGVDGEAFKIKLLTKIPLSITDDEAMFELFDLIQSDVDIAINWATQASQNIWNRYQLRIKLSKHGIVFKKGATGRNSGNDWITNRSNPNHLCNAAATLEHYGHIDNSNLASVLLPQPLPQTAFELGIPTSGALLPHCTLLVANHPEITTSFLENLELYDKNGKQTGFVKMDGSHKLIGYKVRRGSELAQQIITLNEHTVSITKQLIALTNPLREYLRKKGDDDWRYLLLSAKRGFGYPNRIKRIASDTGMTCRGLKFVDSLKSFTLLSYDQCLEYANNFDITSLRASCAVLIYLKTRSIKEMSKALGHAELDMKLIRRYLPDLIHTFFQERWIRIFQTGLIIEAMKESDNLLEASGFNTMEELDLFLKNHALKVPIENSENINLATSDSLLNSKDEVVFGINTTILTLLISLQQAVQTSKSSVHELANFWAEFSTHLIKHIESKESYRPDIQNYLKNAMTEADPRLIESIIYV
ncbi:MAG TPA: hypothetical protein VIO39_06810 [Methylotenera sp.]